MINMIALLTVIFHLAKHMYRPLGTHQAKIDTKGCGAHRTMTCKDLKELGAVVAKYLN